MLGFTVKGLRLRVQGFWFLVHGLGFILYGEELKVMGLKFWI